MARLAVAADRWKPAPDANGRTRLFSVRDLHAWACVVVAVEHGAFRRAGKQALHGDHHVDAAAGLVADAVSGVGIRHACVFRPRRSGAYSRFAGTVFAVVRGAY